MVFEYTYSGKLLKEIEAREKEIAMLREDVREMIVKNDYRLLQTYEDLLEKMDDFPNFKKKKELEIKDNLLDRFEIFKDKYREIFSNNLKEGKIHKYTEQRIQFDLLNIYGCIAKQDYKQTTMSSTFAWILTLPQINKSDIDLIMEIYDLAKEPLSCLYVEDLFEKMPKDIKIGCFRDTIQEVRNNIREWQFNHEIEENSRVFKKLTEMMKDDDVKTFLSLELAPESTSLECYARILDEYYPASSEVFEEDNKMPKEIRDFIDTVENLSKEKNKEEELEI